MNRRQFFAMIVAAPILIAQPPVVYAQKEEQAFAQCFNAWATMGNQNGNIVDVKEIRLWHATEVAWNKLRSLVRQSYK